MAKSYPIWVEIDSCIYNSNKSYGIKEHSTQIIKVGSSAKNAHEFLDVVIRKREVNGKLLFTYSCDGVLLKEMTFEMKKDGTAGKLLKTRSKLKSIKSLKSGM